jgi:hypothetical protein
MACLEYTRETKITVLSYHSADVRVVYMYLSVTRSLESDLVFVGHGKADIFTAHPTAALPGVSAWPWGLLEKAVPCLCRRTSLQPLRLNLEETQYLR